MRLTRTIWPVLLPLAALCAGCGSKPVILDGGHYHPHGATVTPERWEEPYTIEGPIYVIPEETFRALVTP